MVWKEGMRNGHSKVQITRVSGSRDQEAKYVGSYHEESIFEV